MFGKELSRDCPDWCQSAGFPADPHGTSTSNARTLSGVADRVVEHYAWTLSGGSQRASRIVSLLARDIRPAPICVHRRNLELLQAAQHVAEHERQVRGSTFATGTAGSPCRGDARLPCVIAGGSKRRSVIEMPGPLVTMKNTV